MTVAHGAYASVALVTMYMCPVLTLHHVAGGSNTNVLQLDVRGSGINPQTEPATSDLSAEHLDQMLHSQWGMSASKVSQTSQ